MNLNLATIDDLQHLKSEIINEISKLFSAISKPHQPQINVLKSSEVKRILKCSDSKLEGLRNSGSLPFKKVMGVHYYKLEDVENLLDYSK